MDGSWCNCVLVLEEVGSKVVLQRTATGPGAQQESLSDIQRHVRRVDNDLRAQVDQYSIETGVMEDVVSTVHFGLVEVGASSGTKSYETIKSLNAGARKNQFCDFQHETVGTRQHRHCTKETQ